MLNRKHKLIQDLKDRNVELTNRNWDLRGTDRYDGPPLETVRDAAELMYGIAEALERKSRKLRVNNGFDLERIRAMQERAEGWRSKAAGLGYTPYVIDKGEHLHSILKRHLSYRTPKRRGRM